MSKIRICERMNRCKPDSSCPECSRPLIVDFGDPFYWWCKWCGYREKRKHIIDDLMDDMWFYVDLSKDADTPEEIKEYCAIAHRRLEILFEHLTEKLEVSE